MCEFQSLVHNSSGYIIRCHECKNIQLAFGTTLVTMNMERFQWIAQNISMEYQYRNPSADPEIKKIIVSVDKQTMLCLSFNELEKLHHMFLQAGALLEVYGLLETEEI